MSNADSVSATLRATVAEGNSVAQTWRLTKWYLFTVRRRLMSKILLGLMVGFFLISIGFNVLGYILLTSTEVVTITQCVPTVTGSSPAGTPSPGNGPSCQQLQQDQQQEALDNRAAARLLRQSLTFPYSLSSGGGYLGSMGTILFCIMASALVGSEYSSGTLRLALSRGTRRGQVIAAQVGALAILSLATAFIVQVLAAIAGVTVGPLIGGTLPALSPAAGLEVVVYWLATTAGVFAFGLIAFLMATLSRNVIAGIGVSLGYLIFESIVGNVLYFAGVSLHTSIGDFISHIPNYLVGYNTGALAHLAAASPIGLYSASTLSTSENVQSSPSALLSPGASIDTIHALVVTLVYCLLFAGLSYLFLRRRDVSE
jgi:ABC-type transport system involved in multi-copper enzyme maturation permease subunit